MENENPVPSAPAIRLNLLNGLVAYYPCNGNAKNASAKGLDATVYGATLIADRFGHADSAYQFDGIDDYIETQASDLLNFTENFTISLWIKPSPLQPQTCRLVDKMTAETNTGFCFDLCDGKMRLTTGTRHVLANTVCSLNEWHHLAVAFSKGVTTFYLDGILDGSGKQGNVPVKANSLTIRLGMAHAESPKTFPFSGVMNEIRFYKRVLSAIEIEALYKLKSDLLNKEIVTRKLLTFDGKENGFVSLPAINFSYTKGFTVEAWVWYNSFQHWSRIIDLGNGEGQENIVFANLGSTNALAIYVKRGTVEQYLQAEEVLETNTWIHLAATIDASGNAKLFKNGTEVKHGALHLPQNIQRTQNYIGKSNWAIDGYFDGCLTEVRIWNQVRTPAKIEKTRYQQLTGNETGLVGYWPLNESAGTTVFDKTSHKNNGTIHGHVTWQQYFFPLLTESKVTTVPTAPVAQAHTIEPVVPKTEISQQLNQSEKESSMEQKTQQSPEVKQPEAKQEINPDARLAQARLTIRNYTLGSLGLAVVPIPIVDLIALTGIQLKMLHSLANIYNVPFSKDVGKSLIASLTGGFAATWTTMPLASLLKFIPGVGYAAGVVSLSALSGATTYAVGRVFVQHFEAGGNLLNFSPEKMKAFFAEQVKEGKLVVAELQSSSNAKT